MTAEEDTPVAGRAGRRGVLLGAGAVALAAGAGAAWWQVGSRSGGDDAATTALWAVTVPQPDGTPLALQALRGRPVLVNFWATWCPPCVEELPLIDAFHRQHTANGWQVVGLALDKPAAVQAFLAKMQLSFPIGILGLSGMSVLKPLGNVGGGLPFTVVLNAAGDVHARKMGQITPGDLQQWVGGTTRS